MKFSEQFKLFRKKLRLSKEEMGLQFGFSHPKLRVWEIENGRYDAKGPSNQIRMICAFLAKHGSFTLKVKKKVKSLKSGDTFINNGKEKQKETEQRQAIQQ